MAHRQIFADEESKMDLYVNQDNRLFMEIVYMEDTERSGFITLPVEDVEVLQQELSKYLTQMKSNG